MMDKLEWFLDKFLLGVMLAVILIWTYSSEDIVGTRELAVVLLAVLLHDVRCKSQNCMRCEGTKNEQN